MAQEIFKIFGTYEIKGADEASRAIDDVDESASKSKGSLNSLDDGFGDLNLTMGGVATFITGTLLVAIGDLISKSEEYDNTLLDMKANTHSSNEELATMEKTMKDLYLQGYGETFQDVADAMTAVKQQTGATNKELEMQTQNVITLSEKLGTDYGETILSIDNMTKNMGITHEEAFDMIARGYQEGLNSQGDLLDLINEYSIQLDQAGIDSEEFYQILKEGKEQGIVSFDILLDGIKEFNIRMKEGSDETIQAIDDLGLKGEDIIELYSKGGESAEIASEQVQEALAAIEDPIERNRIGVALYGTMWEDTGGKINDVLVEAQDQIVETEGAMEELNNTKMDSLGDTFETMKRRVLIDVMIPLGKGIENKLVETANSVKDFNDKFMVYWDKLVDWQEGFNKRSGEKWDDFVKNTKTKLKGLQDDWDNWWDNIKSIATKKAIELGIEWTGKLEKIKDDIGGVLDDLSKNFNNTLDGISDFFDPVISGLKDVYSWIGNVINKIGQINFPSVPDWIPGFETGVRNFAGGLAIVGEKGPELVYLPQGSDVYSNTESRSMLNTAQSYQEVTPATTQNVNYNNVENVNVKLEEINGLSELLNLFENFKTSSMLY